MRGTVVLTTYNSAGSIEAVLAEIEEAASILARSGFELDILIVDNDSPDGTVAIARRQAERLGLDVDAIESNATHPSAALLTGLRHVLDHGDALGLGGPQEALGLGGAQETLGLGGAQETLGLGGAQETLGLGGPQEALDLGGAQETLGLGGAQETLGLGGAQETQFIVTLDPNGHHDARQITDLVRAFVARRSGLTIGSRWVSGGSSPGAHPWRAIASRTAGAVVRRVSGLRGVRDATTSFWVFSPDVARTLLAEQLLQPGFAFYSTFVALTQAYGFTIDEVPISFRPRYSGIDSVTLDQIAEFARSLAPLRRRTQSIRADMRADQPTWATRSNRMLDQDAQSGSSFGADVELERLAEAGNFFGWIADELAPHLGQRILEVGAGIGTMSIQLIQRLPGAQLTALEPDPSLHERLVARTKRHPEVQTLNVTSEDLLSSDIAATFDSLVYVNVLEHILDDGGELRRAFELLVPGGTLAVFVPALPRLYGSMDFKSGHYRRYTRDSLGTVITEAGLDHVDVRYFDILGAAPYFVMYKLLDIKSLGTMSAGGYDRVIVPASRALQRVAPHPPLGKNLLAIARRPH